jgi:DnaK suppressor protein
MTEAELLEVKLELLRIRDEVQERRRTIDETWRSLNQPEVEFEETAQKSKMSLGLDRLDDQEKTEILEIDHALARISAGSYGVCEACGGLISVKRLKAIPFTRWCVSCAEDEQARSRISAQTMAETDELPPEEIRSTGLPLDFAGLSDRELSASLYDALRSDGRVNLAELEIVCDNGVVFLRGALPGERDHQIMLQVIQDLLGIQDLVDEVNIQEILWERPDRTPLRNRRRKTEVERRMEGEEEEILPDRESSEEEK